ncbi:hypothetical protein EJB05_51848 [Eragrostis curvula]|uniref:Uncharacterized protein n=1 Tax=Eragrostis curvula TaxID=38414 RepID=A0A5J9SUD1_9POAL|nr:hypothetical protein EJB05_51848 [Eragrostis curvula]
MPAPQTRSSASSTSFAVPILLSLLPQPRSVSSRTIPLIKSLDLPISCAAYQRPCFLAPSNGRPDQRIRTPQPASTTLVRSPADLFPNSQGVMPSVWIRPTSFSTFSGSHLNVSPWIKGDFPSVQDYKQVMPHGSFR